MTFFQLTVLVIVLTAINHVIAHGEWSHSHSQDWATSFPTCSGSKQSPVALHRNLANSVDDKPLNFHNYDLQLTAPLVLYNDGHEVELDLPVATNGERPQITGGFLPGRFEALAIHFHWGSATSTGSEHTINGKQYDVEMHIVHKNVNYATVAEAKTHSDGIAVLGFMLNKANKPESRTAFKKIFAQMDKINAYKAEAVVESFSLSELLENSNRNQYYSYSGSLTTPSCEEAVTWHVFPDVIEVDTTEIEKFYKMMSPENEVLKNVFRPAQELNERTVHFYEKPSGVLNTIVQGVTGTVNWLLG